jgi:hypothetical protein
MTNAEMIPNRFLKVHQARSRYRSIVAHLQAGGSVQLVTYTRATQYGPKHLGFFKISGSSIYVQRGKSWDCIDFTPIRFSRIG